MFGTRSPYHEYFEPSDTAESRDAIGRITAAARDENRAAATRLGAIADLFEMRRAERGENADWAVDTWAAVGAEVAAALRISLGKAGSYMNQGLALNRLPAIAAVFRAGDIDAQTFQMVAYRTDLVTDDAAIDEIDRRIAVRIARLPTMSRGRLAREIDRIVLAHDPDAVRRNQDRCRDRDVTVWNDQGGISDVSARLFTSDAYLLDKRLDELAAGVCEADPRTVAQRRADSLGALAAGADRLMCRCGEPTCTAAAASESCVVIHVVAEQSTLEGRGDRPGHLLGADCLITAEILRDVAVNARLRPVSHPAAAPAEPGYRPSRALADFVRARDLTCRAPGCDRPATECDIDHTIPYPRGRTHASNLKCLCRQHHLIKTFWGWHDRQLSDGTIIWTAPGDRTYVTTPGSALLFPSLMSPTGDLPDNPAPQSDAGHRAALMPLRKSTREANRAHRIATERAHNHRWRATRNGQTELGAVPAPQPGDEPPPF